LIRWVNYLIDQVSCCRSLVSRVQHYRNRHGQEVSTNETGSFDIDSSGGVAYLRGGGLGGSRDIGSNGSRSIDIDSSGGVAYLRGGGLGGSRDIASNGSRNIDIDSSGGVAYLRGGGLGGSRDIGSNGSRNIDIDSSGGVAYLRGGGLGGSRDIGSRGIDCSDTATGRGGGPCCACDSGAPGRGRTHGPPCGSIAVQVQATGRSRSHPG
jgi:hypothetical protein